ncbi:5430_t:CDS:2 [Funneliformis caledonium]|uniref:5430_t:CDS:1 n=1 Tax=Funneliformis caledonium TaxID=1117310 RepID=A0A9N8ZL00_9GLOM|nr:5430_t:CDS:2 [Funneliformis caledonium]
MTRVKGKSQESSEAPKKADKPEKKERCSYSVDQKQIVVEYALKHGRNVAARLYKVDKSMVGRWVQASKKWNAEPAKVNWNSLRVGSGQKPLYEEAENQLHKWVSDQHRLGAEITNSNVRNRMYQILKQPDMKVLYPDAVNEFKASSRWLSGFLSRKKLTVLRDRPVFKKRPVCDVVLREYRQYSILKEIKADDAMQRSSQSQNEVFNNEYMVKTEVEDEVEKMNKKSNEEPITEIHEIFDKYTFVEADPLAESSSFVSHTQSHVQPIILRFNSFVNKSSSDYI